MSRAEAEHVETIVVGAGQAGLSVGYHLTRRNCEFLIIDAHGRVGDSWRQRWDSLRLFTPAQFDGLDGMPFPAPAGRFPTKDEMADYLQAYAQQFRLPVRTGLHVDSLSHDGTRFVIAAGQRRLTADNVVIAMSNFQQPLVPEFAASLDPTIAQLHSSRYRSPAQLGPGAVLVAGAGNSGAEIGLELVRTHQVLLSGRDTGHVPFRIDGPAAQLILSRMLLRGLFHRVLTVDTPIGRRARPRLVSRGGPLIRVKPEDLAKAGVQRVPRVVGTAEGLPLLDDGKTVTVANVIWCTGFRAGFSWIHIPSVRDGDEPRHRSGVVASRPGLYFVGLHFLHALSSAMVHGVGRDARRVAQVIANRAIAAAEPVTTSTEHS